MLLALSSCDNRPNVLGSWQGTMRQSVPGQTQDMIVTYNFAKDGTIAATYMINIAEPLPPVDSIVNAYQMNVSAMASMNGVWQYVKHEDDEISLAFDPNTINVTIDPEAVVYKANIITAQQEPALEALKPVILDHYKQLVYDEMRRAQMNQLLEDVDVKSPVLTFEMNDVDYTFHTTTPLPAK